MEKVQSANKSWLLRHWNFDSIHVTKFSGWNRTAWENVTMSGRCLVPKQRRTDPHQKTITNPSSDPIPTSTALSPVPLVCLSRVD